jgi:hypothetical protein
MTEHVSKAITLTTFNYKSTLSAVYKKMSRKKLAVEFLEKVGFEGEGCFVFMKSLRNAAFDAIAEMRADLMSAFPPSFIGILDDINVDCNNRKITSLVRRMGSVGGYAVVPKRVQKRDGKVVKTLYKYKLVACA